MNEKLFELAKNGGIIKLGLLVGKGVDVSVTDDNGKSALMHAAENDRYKEAGLLANKSDINVTDNTGKTALMYACEKGSYRVVGLLFGLNKGLDTAAVDSNGKTALDYAQANGDIKTLKAFDVLTERSGPNA